MATSNSEEGTHHCFNNDRSFQECKIHPGHKEFMTIDEFLNKKPSDVGLRDEDMPTVRNAIDRTVRVVVNCSTADRPETCMSSKTSYAFTGVRGCYKRYGTGFLIRRYTSHLGDPCHCPKCKTLTSQTPNRESFYFIIKTDTHVIDNEQEARNAVFDFFFDDEDGDAVKTMYGTAVLDPNSLRQVTDRCLVIGVTHDCRFAEKLDFLCGQFVHLIRGIVVSHPHGVSKRMHVSGSPTTDLDITSAKLKKDSKIRFPDCRNARFVFYEINRLLMDDKPVIDISEDNILDTFVLLCDLTICSPGRIQMKIIDFGSVGLSPNNDKMLRFTLPPGAYFTTDNGKTYEISEKQLPILEVFGKVQFIQGNSDEKLLSSHSGFGSCPGSSGAYDNMDSLLYGFGPFEDVLRAPEYASNDEKTLNLPEAFGPSEEKIASIARSLRNLSDDLDKTFIERGSDFENFTFMNVLRQTAGFLNRATLQNNNLIFVQREAREACSRLKSFFFDVQSEVMTAFAKPFSPMMVNVDDDQSLTYADVSSDNSKVFGSDNDLGLKDMDRNDEFTASWKQNIAVPVTLKAELEERNERTGKEKNTGVEDEKKSMDDRNTGGWKLEKISPGTKDIGNAAKSKATPFVSGRKLRGILMDIDKKRAVSGGGKSEGTGGATESLPLPTTAEDSEEQKERDHQSSLEKTMIRSIWGTHHGNWLWDNCKSERHDEFKNVNCVDNSPGEIFKFEEDKPILQKLINRTVRVVAYYTSECRPDIDVNWKKPYPCRINRGSNRKRYGTGYLHGRFDYRMQGKCPCFECKCSIHETPNRDANMFVIRTATHVIFDEDEAQNAVFEFFYDSKDGNVVKKIYGVTVLYSTHTRLETDKCSVICITHNSSLAEELNLLCDEIEVTKSWYLVSHPHGERKRISVDHTPDSAPCGSIVIKLDKKHINLKTDMKIRLLGTRRDDACVQRDIQSLLDANKPVFVSAYEDDTYKLTCDVTIRNPNGIILETGSEFLNLYEHNDEEMWSRLGLGTYLVTDDGREYKFANKNGGHVGACMKVLGNIKYLLDSSDKDKLKIFVSSQYKMATCPGSSGAHVDVLGNVHYGTSIFGHAISSWTCVYEPKHFEVDPQTIEENDCPYSLRDLVEVLLQQ